MEIDNLNDYSICKSQTITIEDICSQILELKINNQLEGYQH